MLFHVLTLLSLVICLELSLQFHCFPYKFYWYFSDYVLLAHQVAWVTKPGESELEIPVAIRPTSETVMLMLCILFIDFLVTNQHYHVL